jgi:alpha-beta hydrolase superfamily lysophospholipase
MTVRTVRFQSDGLELVGRLHSPDGVESHATLCICHGIPATPQSPNHEGYDLLAGRFCQAGFLTLVFNFRGTGASEGNIDLEGWTRDLQAALELVLHLPESTSSRLGLLGFSGGAAVAVHVASRDVRVASVVTCACPARFDLLADRESGQERVDHFRQMGVIRDPDFPQSITEWLNGFDEVSPIRHVHGISPRPLLIIHGDADEVVPVDQAHMLYRQAGEPKELVIIRGGQHRLRLDDRAMSVATAWLLSTLSV